MVNNGINGNYRCTLVAAQLVEHTCMIIYTKIRSSTNFMFKLATLTRKQLSSCFAYILSTDCSIASGHEVRTSDSHQSVCAEMSFVCTRCMQTYIRICLAQPDSRQYVKPSATKIKDLDRQIWYLIRSKIRLIQGGEIVTVMQGQSQGWGQGTNHFLFFFYICVNFLYMCVYELYPACPTSLTLCLNTAEGNTEEGQLQQQHSRTPRINFIRSARGSQSRNCFFIKLL